MKNIVVLLVQLEICLSSLLTLRDFDAALSWNQKVFAVFDIVVANCLIRRVENPHDMIERTSTLSLEKENEEWMVG